MDVIYCDDAIVVVDKPTGLSVHRGDDQGSTFALNLTRNAIGQWVYPVHRLDRATSGVLVFALSPEHARTLQESFNRREVDKTYLALVRGKPPPHGVIDSPMEKREGGPDVEAVTEYETLFASDIVRVSLVRARPLTGRRHQIRRHLRRINHPIAGDVRYGKGIENRSYRIELGLYRLALHAQRLSLTHPTTGERVVFESTVPEDLREPLGRAGVPEDLLGLQLR
ncbi:MAG: pseudouridylate synthase [Myxococcales bacterium]|nr:MAG: pseudouridylate synthase [Myxococcales bacterium]